MTTPPPIPPPNENEEVKYRTPHAMHIRIEVLQTSLYAEHITTHLTSLLLGINQERSTVFSNSSQAMPFMQRVTLLGEIGALSSKDKTLLSWFAQIRNNTVHNYAAKDPIHFLPKKSDQDALIERFEIKDGKDQNQKLSQAIIKLTLKLRDLITEIYTNAMRKRITSVVHHHSMTYTFQAFDRSFREEFLKLGKELMVENPEHPMLERLIQLRQAIDQAVQHAQANNDLVRSLDTIRFDLFEMPDLKLPSDPTSPPTEETPPSPAPASSSLDPNA